MTSERKKGIGDNYPFMGVSQHIHIFSLISLTTYLHMKYTLSIIMSISLAVLPAYRLPGQIHKGLYLAFLKRGSGSRGGDFFID